MLSVGVCLGVKDDDRGGDAMHYNFTLYK
jgi:hypothetical protein